MGFLITYRRRREARFKTFQETMLPFKHILETGNFPNDRHNYGEFITKLFSDQDNAMIIIRDRLKGKRRDIFDQKLAAYKKQREGYNKPYWDAKVHNVVERQLKDKEILNLINEILEIAKNN